MKWILLVLLLSAGVLQAQDQEYIQIVRAIGQADLLKENGQNEAAVRQYQEAQTALKRLHSTYPKWNSEVIEYRLDYIGGRLKALGAVSTKAAPRTATNQITAPETSSPVEPPSTNQTPVNLPEKLLRSQLDPAENQSADSKRAEKTQEQILSLEKQRALLKVALDQEKNSLEKKVEDEIKEPAPSVETVQAPPAVSETQTPVKAEETQPAVADTAPKTKREIPPGAGALVAQAEKAFAARNYAEAEKKYLEVLRQDENNVYILGNLAATQMEMDHLSDVEANVQRALKVDPDDAFSLTLLGMVKFRQEKYEEALDVLNRSAKIDPKNPETHNYLGITLSQKGENAAAETALRKAVALQPNYAGAHYNLALVYASQKPPFLQLARWHYAKSLALGHPKNRDLEKMLDKK